MATMTPTTRSTVFNLPNQLTASRFFLAIVLFVLIEAGSWLSCLMVFLLATVTDWLDGYMARKQGIVSTLGRNFDPLVDKVLVCGAYIFLLPMGDKQGWLYPWMVTIVVGRELVITGLRSFLENQNVQFGAEMLGKIKMVLQCAALIAIFVALEVPNRLPSHAEWVGKVRDACLYAMLAATLLSGLHYIWRAALLLRIEKEGLDKE